jgi:methylenetetrahydrofolate dehydrogenase (NADP+)/methenyltetrahydrofolate cyclohydrolase
MPARILDGKRIAAGFLAGLLDRSRSVAERIGRRPKLAAVLVGDDPASKVYVRSKSKDCELVEVDSEVIALPSTTSQSELLERLAALNNDPGVDGILVQLPLPKGIDEQTILRLVSADKDVDCFHPINVGYLAEGSPVFLPCTPAGVIEILRRSETRLEGANVVIVGRSNIVGKPLALMMIQKSVGATVTVCHTQTKDLAAEVKRADVVVAAAGKAGLITGAMIKPGAVVIDVGTNRAADGKLVGDVDFASAVEIASAITPVPGGVGPMTRAMLVRNTVEAAARRAVSKGASGTAAN